MDPNRVVVVETCNLTENASNNSAHENVTQNNTTENILPGYATMDEFTQAGFRAVMEGTKYSSQLPTGHNWDLYSSYPSFQRIMDSEGNRIMELIAMIFRHQGINASIVRRDLEEKFDMIVDANDSILERVGCNLDELAGIRRNPEPVLVEAVGSTTHAVSGSWNRRKQPTDSVSCNFNPQQTVRLLTAKNIQRPQIKFKDKIDNSSNPFEPRIKEKPNSLKPLSVLFEVDDSGEGYSHPYEYELELFKVPESQLKKVTPHMYLPVSDTPLVVIAQPEDIPILMADLRNYSEIAVDLEHHSYRTFQGITCLMQISTQDTDYIIDTLELRDKLYCLNEIFTDPKVVKVFHGANHDIEWLQRDLSLYIVNMFDTHQAARLLNFPHLSLAYLLKHYCSINVNKHFQLADWRIRPLPEELINYAREDTHYLLYVYAMMKNALLKAGNGKTNILLSVMQQSTEICKRRYEKSILREDSHMDLYRRNKKLFDNRQLHAFRELYRWRDKTARQEDESLGYVLPNHMLLQISELLPREMQGILACCNPIPPLVRQNLATLHQVVLKSRDQPLVRPVIEEETRIRPPTQAWVKINWESPLHCPHDLTRKQDFREDLPTLLNSSGTILSQMNESLSLESRTPTLTVFEHPLLSESEADDDAEMSMTEKRKQVTFVSPYERYKLVRPFLQSQEEEEAENNAAGSQNDDDGDEARIKRIRAHFLKMSVKMEAQTQNTAAEALLDLNVPEAQHMQVTGKRKRVDEEEDASQSSEELVPKPKLKQPKLEDVQPTPCENVQKRKRKPVADIKPAKQAKLEEASVSSQPKQRNQRGKQNQKANAKGPKQEFEPFDYSKVDFSRFQGGSAVHDRNNSNTNRGKFRGKKSKFVGKTNHKSFTYGKGRR